MLGEKTADIAIQNGGGCRTDLPSGTFSIGDAYTMLPFSNTMLTMKMSGQQVKDSIEDAVDMAHFGGSSGAYPYASGLRFDVDASRPKGSRVTNIEVNKRLADSWKPIDLDAHYVVVTNNYIAGNYRSVMP